MLSGEEKEKERVSELLVSSSSGRSGRSGRSSFFFFAAGTRGGRRCGRAASV